MARHRRVVLGAYAFVLLLCAIAYPSLQKAVGPLDYSVNNSDSLRVEQLLARRFPGIGTEDDALVFYSSRHLAGEHVYREVITAVDKAVQGQKGVLGVLGPYNVHAVSQISSDEHTAITGIALGGSVDQRFEGTRAIQAAATRAAGGNGVQTWLTGFSPITKDTAEAQQANSKKSEGIGLPVALAILLLAMGALVAAAVPMLLAIGGLLLADGVLTLLTIFFHFDSLLLAVVTMIGLGIGIDYSLFIVSRFREELARAPQEDSESERVADAVGLALATSGRTILFSGVIVALSMAALLVVDFALLREIAVGTVVVVTCMLISAMTLLPAVLASLGPKINRGALPRRRRKVQPHAGDARQGGWARWAMLVMRHPILAGGFALVVLGVAAIPAFHLHYGVNIDVFQDQSTASGKGEKLLAQSFSPGAVAPIQIVVTSRGGPPRPGAEKATAKSLASELEGDSRVTGVAQQNGKGAVMVTAIASVPIDSTKARALVERVRQKLAPPLEARWGTAVFVGGVTAQGVDVSHALSAREPLILALILGASLLFLLVALRSVVLPLKAVLMNLLATAATIGLVVLVFQEGHLEHLLGFTSVGFIQPGVPLLMFALLFGLSMDYEVFLIRRMQEEWKKTHDNRYAVATGLEHTARPIAAAAAIMVAVFGSFMTAELLELKQLGFALAVAIAIDATLVRLILVPAAMRLLGARNWWLPAWLARVIPDLGVD